MELVCVFHFLRGCVVGTLVDGGGRVVALEVGFVRCVWRGCGERESRVVEGGSLM